MSKSNKYLSKESIKVWQFLRENYWEEGDEELSDQLGLKIELDSTTLDKDFCLIELLNFYQDYRKNKNEEYLTEKDMDLLMDFGYFIELIIGTHDGRKKSFTCKIDSCKANIDTLCSWFQLEQDTNVTSECPWNKNKNED